MRKVRLLLGLDLSFCLFAREVREQWTTVACAHGVTLCLVSYLASILMSWRALL